MNNPLIHATVTRKRLTGLLVVLSLLVAGCGNGNSAQEPTSTPTTPGTADVAQTETEEAEPEQRDPIAIDVGLVGGRQTATSGFPIVIAEEMGIFERVGLEPNVIALPSGGELLNGLEGGSLDVAVMGSEGIIARARGVDVISLLGFAQISHWHIVAQEHLTGWEDQDMAGSSVGVSGLNTIPAIVFRMMAEQAGYDPDADFEYVTGAPMPSNFQSVVQGAVDLAPVTVPLAYVGEGQGLTLLENSVPGHEPPRLAMGSITATRDFVEENEEATVRFLEAILLAYNTLHDPDMRDEVVRILNEVTEISSDGINRALDFFTTEPQTDYMIPQNGRHDLEAVQAAIDAFSQAEDLDVSVEVDDWVDESFLEQALERLEGQV